MINYSLGNKVKNIFSIPEYCKREIHDVCLCMSNHYLFKTQTLYFKAFHLMVFICVPGQGTILNTYVNVTLNSIFRPEAFIKKKTTTCTLILTTYNMHFDFNSSFMRENTSKLSLANLDSLLTLFA